MYDYHRKSSESATPIFDRLATGKDLGPELKALVDRAMVAADMAEDSDIKSLDRATDTAVKVAYKMLNTLRPALQGGQREIEAVGPVNLNVVKHAKALVEALRSLDREHYGPLANNASGMEPAERIKKIHDTAMKMSDVKDFYQQFRKSYGRR